MRPRCAGRHGQWREVPTMCPHVHSLQAYSPYTHCPSGVALVDASGGVHRGSYLESAAFNPGTAPVKC